MKRSAELERKTGETAIRISLDLDGKGRPEITTGIAFFDHMLTLTAVHGFFDLSLKAQGDLEVDSHHTVEDVGIVMGMAFHQALGDRRGIRRYGHAVIPMDDALAAVTVDLSNRPFLVYRVQPVQPAGADFNVAVAREFFRAFANHAGLNLHINLFYGENEHHILEAIFKGLGRALDAAVSLDPRSSSSIPSSKGVL